MTGEPNDHVARSLRWCSKAIAAGSVVVGCTVLAGWVLGAPSLSNFGLGQPPMRPNAALGIALAGLSLWLLQEGAGPRTHAVGMVLAACAMALGLVTSAEYALGWDAGIDGFLASPHPDSPGPSSPLRMSANSAACLTFLGAALLMIDVVTRRGAWLAQAPALFAMLVALLAALGHIYGAHALARVGHHTVTAGIAATASFALSIGVLLSRPERGITRMIACPCPGGAVLRRLLPAFLLITFGLGLATVLAQRDDYLDASTALSLVVAGVIVASTVAAFVTAHNLHRTDAERASSEREARDLLDRLTLLLDLSSGILGEETVEVMLQRVADAACGLTGAESGTIGHRYSEHAFQSGVFCSPADPERYTPGQVVRVERGGVHMRIVEEARPVRLTESELQQDPDWWGLPEGHVPLRGLLGVPLVDRDGTGVGLIMVSSKKGGEFTATDELLLSHLATLALLALWHAEATTHARRHAVELVNANQELEAFSYSVSHDLRAPLRAVDGFSLALAEDCTSQLDEQGKDYVNRIRAATKRMGELIDDMLTLSRIMRRDMNWEAVDLSSLAQSVAEELRSGEPDRAVEFAIEPDLLALGDAHLLRTALENLIANAWKFSAKRECAKIEFGATETDGGRAYFVRDNGAGFDPAYADKLFVPFQRLHSTAEFPGTGIGLATVHRIVRRHGGRVWAEGAVDKGAVFYFTL